MNQSVFEFIRNAITGTPFWVWGIFAYLLFVGIKSRHDHVVYLPKLFIVPAVLLGLKYKVFMTGNSTDVLVYIASMIVGIGIGFFIASKIPIKVLKDLKSIELPGTYSTFVILLSFFFIKYIFGYLKGTNPDLAAEYFVFDILFSALFSGYFLGRAISYLYRFLKR